MSKNKLAALFTPATQSDMPAHIDKNSSLGNENVSQNDLQVPRLKLLQDLSPECKKSKAEYVPGAEPGKLLVTTTSELLDSVYVINLKYTRGFNLWKKRELGGGLFGSFASEAEAEGHMQSNNLPREQYDIVETADHHCLRVNPETGDVSPIIVSFQSTGLRISNQWNTQLQLLGGDRFASIWELAVSEASNNRGTWYALQPKNMGWVNEELYNGAKETYATLA